MLVSHQGAYNKIKDKYLAAKQLIDRKNDPWAERLKCMNTAKNLLVEIVTDLPYYEKGYEFEIVNKDVIVSAGLLHALAIVLYEVDGFTVAEEVLLRALGLLMPKLESSDCILTSLSILLELGSWYYLERNDNAYKYISQAESVYKQYQESDTNQEIIDFQDIILQKDTDQEEAKKALDKIHCEVMICTAIVSGWLKEPSQELHSCHNMLQEQLSLSDFDKLDWAHNAARLSRVLLHKNAVKEGRHYLACADYALNLRQKELEDKQEQPLFNEWNTELIKGRADVCRSWIKYCIYLLSVSKDLIALEKTEDSTEQVPNVHIGLHFDDIDVSSLETTVTADWILTWEEARQVFLKGQESVNAAKGYYTPSEFPLDHLSILKDYASLYQAISLWEENASRMCKMIRKRIGILSDALAVVNPTFNEVIYRDVWYELGETYNSLIELKKGMMSPNDPRVPKINVLIDQAVEYYDKFIKSFKIPGKDKFPDRLPSGYDKVILFAYLRSLRLVTNRVCIDRGESLMFTQLALDRYKDIIEYASKQPDDLLSQEEIKDWYDMVSYLPDNLRVFSPSE